MPTPKLREKDVEATIKKLAKHKGLTYTEAAIKAGVSPATAKRHLAIAKQMDLNIPEFRKAYGERIVHETHEIPELPEDDIPVEEIIEQRKREFSQKKAHEEAHKLIPVNIKTKGPIGILHFGDPHVDDDGTDIETLEHHMRLTREVPGLFGANVGDTTNNWVGRLARLYGQQNMGRARAIKVAEWFITNTNWLYMIGGNHDCHDTETEALTKRGWLKYDQISNDDEVLSFDGESGLCHWSPIKKKIVRDHSGEMVAISTRSIDLYVTPNHRVLHKDRDWKRDWRDWKYSEAKSLPARVALPVSGMSQREDYNLSDDQISFAGWVLTDGSISWTGNSPRISLYQSKDGSEIERLLVALNLEHTHSVRQREKVAVCGRALIRDPLPAHEWRLTAEASRKVLEWLPEKKRLPEWAGSISTRQWEVLLDALVSGDGTWDGGNPEEKSVAVLHGEEGFLDSVQAIAVQHGWNARISVARGKDYRLNLCKRDTIQFETNGAVTTSHYEGVVWCLTVPLGNFMIRRGGAAHFSGNCWSGEDDPIRWMAKSSKALYRASEARMELRFPKGEPFRINARHDFAGDSQWNPAHGLMKAFQLGVRDHLFVAGHKHVSAHAVMKDPASGITGHALRVSSYKLYDRYAKEKGFRDQTLSPCAVTVIDPLLPDAHPDRCKVFWDADKGVEYLTFLRNR